MGLAEGGGASAEWAIAYAPGASEGANYRTWITFLQSMQMGFSMRTNCAGDRTGRVGGSGLPVCNRSATKTTLCSKSQTECFRAVGRERGYAALPGGNDHAGATLDPRGDSGV